MNYKLKICKDCGIEYDFQSHKGCPACKSIKNDVTSNPTKNKLYFDLTSNLTENNYKYPALEFIIVGYTIFSGIAFVASFFAFGYIVEEVGFLKAFLFLLCSWLVIILVYSYSELIRIFIRIEENTRK